MSRAPRLPPAIWRLHVCAGLLIWMLPGGALAQGSGTVAPDSPAWLRGDEALALWDDLSAASATGPAADGGLVFSSSPEWRLTRERHSDVVLRFEARTEPGTIAGVVLRALSPPKGPPPAFEVRLADGDSGAVTLIHHANGKENRPAGRAQVESDTRGGWHRFQVDCRSDVLKVWADGTQVMNVRGLVQNVGRIGFRVRKGSLAIRNLEIQEHQWSAPPVPPGVLPGDAPGVTLPAVLQNARPNYTGRAIGTLTQGDVWIALVVDVEGNVQNPRVYRSLAADLDEQAIAAARRWKFTPARLDDKPVAVQVTITLSFTLN